MATIVTVENYGQLIFNNSPFVAEESMLDENPIYRDEQFHKIEGIDYRRQKFRDAKMEQMRKKRDGE